MRTILLLSIFFALAKFAGAQSTYQFYYLSIGSAHYEHDPSKIGVEDYSPQDDIESATTSTLLMKQLFEKEVGAKGSTMISTEDSLVTRQRVFDRMDDLIATIKKDKAAKPFIIFYYCGHGALDKGSLIEFLLMGDYAIDLVKHKSYPHSTNKAVNKIIQVQEINDYFSAKNIEHMILIECCRQNLAEVSGARTAIDTLKSYMYRLIDSTAKVALLHGMTKEDMDIDVAEAKEDQNESFEDAYLGFQAINKFKQPNPVIFATIPGVSTKPVHIPKTKLINFDEIDQTSDIGPLCRRSIIAFDRFLKSGKQLYLIQNYVTDLLDKNLDDNSIPSNSGYKDNVDHARKVVLIRR